MSYLVLSLLTAKQVRDEQVSAVSADAEAMMMWMHGEVGGFLGMIAACEFMIYRNRDAWLYDQTKNMMPETDALFVDF